MGEWEKDQIMGKIIIVSFAFFFLMIKLNLFVVGGIDE